MRIRFRRALTPVALLSVLLSSGLHVAALQGAAWVSMYAAFSQAMPKPEALERTFSGSEPCSLCVAVDGMQAETDQTVASLLRADCTPPLLLDASEVSVKTPPPLLSGHVPDLERAIAGIVSPVETPPPRTQIA